MDSDDLMFQRWVAKGLEKPGKDQYGLAAVLGVDRSAVSKIVTGKRLIKAHEIEKVAAYIEEAPPERVMQVMFEIGGGQEVIPIESDGPIEHVSVAGFHGVEADLALVRGDSMWPLIPSGGRVFIGRGREPDPCDNRQMRAVTLDDGRAFIKVMRRTAELSRWTLESFNAPPIEDVVVVKVGEILRIEP